MKSIPLAILSVALATQYCVASSGYHAVSPPNTIVLAYPRSNVTRGEVFEFGFDGGGPNIVGDNYGFAFNTSVSTILPNRTDVLLFYVTNWDPDGVPRCTASNSGAGPLKTDPNGPIGYSTSINTTISDPGLYTIIWNVTYGTSTNSTIANQTRCDPSRLNYESFVFNASVTVLSQTGNVGAIAPITKVVRTFKPTGLIMSNDASYTPYNFPLLLLGFMSVMAQIV